MSFTKGKNVKMKFIIRTFILKTSNRKEVQNPEENSGPVDIMNCQSDGLFDAYEMQMLCRFGRGKNKTEASPVSLNPKG